MKIKFYLNKLYIYMYFSINISNCIQYICAYEVYVHKEIYTYRYMRSTHTYVYILYTYKNLYILYVSAVCV